MGQGNKSSRVQGRQNERLFVMILFSTLVRNITKAPVATSMHQFHIGHVPSHLVNTLVSVMSINYFDNCTHIRITNKQGNM